MRPATYGWPYVWLAGYPRSGITLLRGVLHRRLGLRTASEYAESQFGKSYNDFVGSVRPREDHAALARDQGLVPIKTHGLPRDDVRAIVVVRDGRTTLQSLGEYYDRNGAPHCTPGQLIMGLHLWRDWSVWLEHWLDGSRPVHVVRYTDLRDRQDEAAGAMAELLGVPLRPDPLPTFEQLHDHNPVLFNRGRRLSDWDEATEAMFWGRHGAMMTRLGFRREGTATP